MISHKHKCIFVEVPKTGSSSIRTIIGSHHKPHLNICQIRFNMQNYWTCYGGIKNNVLSSAYLLLPKKKRFKTGKKQFNSYFKFGFVRNPWDRVVSLYLRREGLQMKKK
ncbi:MAG: sulfotransferase family protein [Symploca sp. SIO2E9]|nr:sulfotransferase family protein [Symploca sp. SIO2E9]